MKYSETDLSSKTLESHVLEANCLSLDLYKTLHSQTTKKEGFIFSTDLHFHVNCSASVRQFHFLRHRVIFQVDFETFGGIILKRKEKKAYIINKSKYIPERLWIIC